MMNGNSLELIGVYKGNTSISSIYNGNLLVWGNKIEPVVVSNYMSGKFLDGTDSTNCWYSDSCSQTINKVYIDVDENYEFNIELNLTKLYGLIYSNQYIERIYHLPITSDTTHLAYVFMACRKLKSVDFTGSDSRNVIQMTNLFYGCTVLESLDISPLNTSSVREMSGMFAGCRALTSLDVSTLDTSLNTSFKSMFSTCTGLTTLDLSNFNTSNGTNFLSMFDSCSSLESVNVSSFDTSKATTFANMFNSCTNLRTIDLSNTVAHNLTTIYYMFYGCTALTTLRLGDWDLSNVTKSTGVSGFIKGCTNLTTVTGTLSGISLSMDISNCPLTNASAMVFINGLANVSGQTLTLSSTTYNTLTSAQIAVATNKGWTVASA